MYVAKGMNAYPMQPVAFAYPVVQQPMEGMYQPQLIQYPQES
jgi:hypothetical protein